MYAGLGGGEQGVRYHSLRDCFLQLRMICLILVKPFSNELNFFRNIYFAYQLHPFAFALMTHLESNSKFTNQKSEAYIKRFQTSRIEFFAKIVNGL